MWSGSFNDHTDPASNGRRADWVFTNRRGGVSQGDFASLNLADHVGDDRVAVARNRDLLARQLGDPTPRLTVIRAEHGNRVHLVSHDGDPDVPAGDGLLTGSRDLALVALAADCAPIVFADIRNSLIGVVHCGWRGIVAGIVPAAIDTMCELGASEPSISAVVGPAICRQCYQVDQDCADQLRTVLPTAATQDSNGQWRADVPGAVHSILSERGITARVIEACTHTDPNLFSYRRDHRTGRQGAAIVLRGPSEAS